MASACPHCGYPLNGNIQKEHNDSYCVVINRITPFDSIAFAFAEVVAISRDISNCTSLDFNKTLNQFLDGKTNNDEPILKTCPFTAFSTESKEIAEQIVSIIQNHRGLAAISQLNTTTTTNELSDIDNAIQNDRKGVVTCPICGSTSVTTGQRGFSLITGFLGSNKTVNRCGKCGHTWAPGKR